jgi:sulfoxide reductase heme-binding subunit YedZ
VPLVASTTTWYVARTGGVVAYLLLSTCVLAGIMLAGKRRVPGLPRFAVEDVHRFLGILAGVFIAVHVGGVALDSVVPFSLTQLVVPFTAGYRPLATGLGIVALELLLAVSVTNRLRARIPYRVWRRAHYGTLVVWLLAATHGILSGTDRDQSWLLGLYALTVVAVAGSVALRFLRARGTKRYGFAVAVSGGALVVLAGLATMPQPAPSSNAVKPAADSIPQIDGALQGTVVNNGSGVVSISGTAATTIAFRIDLLTGDNTVSDSALQMRFASGVTCEGTVTSLDDRGFAGTCAPPGGDARTVQATWTVSNGAVNGTISTTAAPATSDGAAA